MIKNAKSLNTNDQKYKKKQLQTNKRTLILQTPMTFLKGTETKYQMKTKRVLISKEQKKTDIKKKKTQRRAEFDRNRPSFGSIAANRKKNYYEEIS